MLQHLTKDNSLGLPARGLQDQEPGRRLGIPEDGERGSQVRVLHQGLDEADPGAVAGERTTQAGNG